MPDGLWPVFLQPARCLLSHRHAHVPTPEEVGDGIVRMNCGNDWNNQRDLVIETAKKYQRFFFNTTIPRFDFPGPVVLTANPKEEQEGSTPCQSGTATTGTRRPRT